MMKDMGRRTRNADASARPDAAPSGSPRFGYARVLECLRAYRDEAEARPGGAPPDAMDRRRVLARLGAELDAEPELLLARGFDRAYRRVVEGV